MKSFIYSFTILESILIFCIFSIFGINYEGSSSSSLYSLLTVISFALSLFYIIKDAKRYPLSPSVVVLLLIILFWGLLAGKANTSMYKCFAMFCVPAALIANTSAKSGDFSWLGRWLDVFMLVISVSLFFSLPRLLVSISAGDSHYSQSLSYHASLAFAINLFLYKYGELIEGRFKFFNSKYYLYLQLLLSPLQLVTIFFSGGRGGFVVVFASLVLFVITFKGSVNRFIPSILAIILISLAFLSLITSRVDSNFLNILESNSTRLFSYLTSNGVDMSETSGRDEVYTLSWQLVEKSPFFGYGLFEYVDYLRKFPYPHNLFLEWLLQGGTLLCLIATVFLIIQLLKFKRIINRNPEMLLLLPSFTYQKVQLMFSGSYMQTGLFWFFMVLIYSYKKVKQ